MQVVIDELLIGIENETLSLLSVEVHPVRGSKVYGCLCVSACMCHACVCVRERESEGGGEWHHLMMRPT